MLAGYIRRYVGHSVRIMQACDAGLCNEDYEVQQC